MPKYRIGQRLMPMSCFDDEFEYMEIVSISSDKAYGILTIDEEDAGLEYQYFVKLITHDNKEMYDALSEGEIDTDYTIFNENKRI